MRNSLWEKKQFDGEMNGKERENKEQTKKEKENKIRAWERRKIKKGERREPVVHSSISRIPTVESR